MGRLYKNYIGTDMGYMGISRVKLYTLQGFIWTGITPTGIAAFRLNLQNSTFSSVHVHVKIHKKLVLFFELRLSESNYHKLQRREMKE